MTKQILKSGVLTLVLCALASCASRSQVTEEEDVFDKDREKIEETLSSEISFAKDRSELESMREEIPQEKRLENDEKAWIGTLMSSPTVEPNRYNQKFQQMIRKKRTDFQKKVRKLRDDFTKEERSNRKDFMKKAKEKCEQIDPKSVERKALNERYRELDQERKDFFSDQRERRKNFESELNAKSKDFYMETRERQREFNEQMRLYRKHYNDWKKEQDKAKKEQREMNKGSSSSGFQNMNNVPSTPLEP